MKEKTQEKNLNTLNAGITKSRPTNGNTHNGGWTDFRYRLDEVGARGRKITKALADEIERHPLIGGMLAFGLGFVIAKLLFQRSNRDSGQ
jgi:hypothetical protein